MTDTDRTFEEGLDGLDKAFSVQGGLNVDQLRTDSGIYLHHEISDYLSRRQTYVWNESSSLDCTSAFDWVITVPGTAGLRFGRYLIGMAIHGVAPANITGWYVVMGNSGKQPDFPASGSINQILMVGGPTVQCDVLVPTGRLADFPLWCPPGTFLQALVRTSAAAGILTFQASFLTTEQLRNGSPGGVMRAEIKK